MVTEGNNEPVAILTPPLSLDCVSDGEYRAPNLMQRIFSLLKNVGPGSDLTRFQLPPLFNLPKSQLQCFGESVYCIGDDILSKCNNGTSPLDRFINVVGWSLSTTRPVIFGVAPFNPILGETHHVSNGTLNVMLEQVSHHPPVTALHATDEKENVETVWCHHTVPKFNGRSIEAVVHGKRELKLLNHRETYVMDSPRLLIRLLPPGTEWIGNVTICCEESGIGAELGYKGSSFFGFRRNGRAIKGKIFECSTSKTLYEIDGNWDSTVTAKDVTEGKITVIYDGKKAISKLKTPVLKDVEGLRSTESAMVWSGVSQGIMRKEWEKARDAKNSIEQKERELRRERNDKGEKWFPKHFTLSYTQEGVWECSPNHKFVPPAPIVVPLHDEQENI